jgi:hypothetical protein
VLQLKKLERGTTWGDESEAPASLGWRWGSGPAVQRPRLQEKREPFDFAQDKLGSRTPKERAASRIEAALNGDEASVDRNVEHRGSGCGHGIGRDGDASIPGDGHVERAALRGHRVVRIACVVSAD